MIKVNREELAWAAGFFDGEGCTWSKDRSGTDGRLSGMSIGMQVSQSGPSNVDPPVELTRFQNAVLGQGRLRNRHAARQPHYKFSWDWRANTWQEVQTVGAMLFSLWSDTKRAQFLRNIQLFRESPSWGRGIGNPNAKTMVQARWSKNVS